MNALEIVKTRKSVRTFDGTGLTDEDLERIKKRWQTHPIPLE